MRYKPFFLLTTELIAYSLHSYVYCSIWKKMFQAHSAYGVVDGIRLDELDYGGSTEASKRDTFVIYDYAHIDLGFFAEVIGLNPFIYHLSNIKWYGCWTKYRDVHNDQAENDEGYVINGVVLSVTLFSP